ncbi:MAG TPA: S41 family peptidase [Pyrinomonadaceae bacterium]
MKSYERFAMLMAVLSIIASTLMQPAQGTAAAQESVKGSARTREATSGLRQRTFEIVWRTIKEKHFDPNFNGVDWNKVHDVYAPRIAKVRSDKEFYEVLQEMLNELHQSHFVVIPPELTHKPETKDQQEASVGLSLRIIDDEAVISRVLPDSPAARAGLKPGFVIKEIDGETVEQIAAPLLKRKESPASLRATLNGILEERQLGSPDTSLRLTVLGVGNEKRALTIKREMLKGEMSPPVGGFPSFLMEFESKRLADGIGYVRFNMFLPVLNQRIRAAVRSMEDAPGIIIDLRGNPGGFDGVGQGLAGLFLDKQVSLGKSRSRQGYENYVVYPLKNPYAGPVVVLIDSMSGSASESFSGGMQSIGRAVVIGERSGGGDLDASIDTLPTGALLLYAYADFVTAKGESLEGRGVTPDIEAHLTRASLLNGNDPQLEAAINYIKKQSGQQK